MSTEVQDRDLAGRKRSHGDFLNPESCGPTSFRDSDHFQTDHSLSDKENDVQCTSFEALASSQAKSSSSLSDPASSPLNAKSPSPSPAPANPSTPARSTSATTKSSAQKATTGEPPKKKRLTTEEKAARDAEKRKRDEEREKKKREKDEAEKLKAQEKAAKAEAEKLKAQQKAEEKAAKAAEKAEKEQEKKQRAEEREKKKREKEEEEAKKARSQMRLTSMFNRTAITPKKEAASKFDNGQSTGATAKNEAKETSLYDQMFKPFFIKENVKLARNPLQMDEETREAKTKILDEYLSGKRQHPTTTFEPLETLQIPYKVRRGRVYPSVKKIMSEFEGLSTSTPADQTTESQNAQMRHTLEVLKSVPVKSIKFREDVRPPYVGTISGLPPGVKSLQKLARKPISKILPLNYDYDSEAEWQEEEGEDVDDLDDDEEDAELDEDMEDFLDDSEDTGPARRVFSGGMEPESFGPCWENRKRSSAEPKLYKYRLEFVLEPLEHHHSIDPFSTSYWESPKSKGSAANEPSAASTSTSTSTTTASTSSGSAQDARANPMAPPPAPSDAFQALNPGAAAAGTKKSQQPLPMDMQKKLKDLVRSMPTLSKVGVIELFAANHAGCPRSQIKTSFEALFEKSGKVFKVKGE